MSRRWFKKFTPSHSKLSQDKWLTRVFGRLLHNPNYLHLNRRSVASGIANGVFWAFIPLPAQTVFATATAVKTRGNIPLAIAFTWISNPLTMLPCAYAAYRVGLLVTAQPPIENFAEDLKAAFDQADKQGIFAAMRYLWNYAVSNAGRLWPFAVGSVVLAGASAAASYFVVRWLWKLGIIWRHRARLLGRETRFAARKAARTV